MAKKQKAAAVAESEIEVVTKPGLGIDEGIVLTTTFLLVLAIVLVVMANKTYTG
jgi:hypothetical protein